MSDQEQELSFEERMRLEELAFENAEADKQAQRDEEQRIREEEESQKAMMGALGWKKMQKQRAQEREARDKARSEAEAKRRAEKQAAEAAAAAEAYRLQKEEEAAELARIEAQTVRFSNGDRYVGEFKTVAALKVPHGFGEYTWADGSPLYEGDWRDGAMHGKGTIYWRAETDDERSGASWNGRFVEDELQGYGLYTFPQEDVRRKGKTRYCFYYASKRVCWEDELEPGRRISVKMKDRHWIAGSVLRKDEASGRFLVKCDDLALRAMGGGSGGGASSSSSSSSSSGLGDADAKAASIIANIGANAGEEDGDDPGDIDDGGRAKRVKSEGTLKWFDLDTTRFRVLWDEPLCLEPVGAMLAYGDEEVRDAGD